jgi:arginine/lysine/histidine transporter system substrate-binding protein
MKTTRILVAVVLVAVLALSATGCAATSKNLVMGTSSGFEPFEFTDANQKVIGIDVDIATLVAKEAGKTLVVEDMNFDSLIAAVQTGKIDFIAAGMTANDERRQNVDFSDTYYDASQVIIVKKGSSIATAADLVGKKIAVQQGTTGDDLATDIDGTTIDRLTKVADCVTELNQGKVDAVVIDSFPAEKSVAKNPDLTILSEPLSVEQYAIAVKKGNTKLLATINKVIAAMKADGSLETIVASYETK